jgi:hypothetical protein
MMRSSHEACELSRVAVWGSGETARIQEMLSSPINARFFDDVATGAAQPT